MSLDIRITRSRKTSCAYCGEMIGYKEIECVDSGGRAWYEPLESLGYYVPYEERTKENDWYSKDMVITKEQAMQIRNFVGCFNVYNCEQISDLIAAAILDGDDVVINADW